jgi:FkbM family methyltransferase
MDLIQKVKQWLGRGPTEWGLRIARDQKRIEKFLSTNLHRHANCIDVGAHQGDFLDLFLRYAPAGTHWAFEPLPDYATRLQTRFPGIRVYQVALSDEEGETEFFRAAGAEAMSGLRPQHYPEKVALQTLTVQVRKLDNLIPPDVPIDFIKLDVEGAELKVLKGAVQLLTRCRPAVMFEFAKLHVAGYDVSPMDIFRFFSGLDYGICRLDGTMEYSPADFEANFISSFNSGYDRHAETNFLALPSGRTFNQ